MTVTAATYGIDIGGTSTDVVRLAPDGSVDARAVTPTAHGAGLVAGTSAAHLTASQLVLAKAVLASGRPTVHVALRTPYDVAVLPSPTALCTYGIRPPTIAALADALVGLTPAEGRLPVRLEAVRPEPAGTG